MNINRIPQFQDIVRAPLLHATRETKPGSSRGYYIRINVPESQGCDEVAALCLAIVPTCDQVRTHVVVLPTSKALAQGGIVAFNEGLREKLQPLSHGLGDQSLYDLGHPFFETSTHGEGSLAMRISNSSRFDADPLDRLVSQYCVPEAIVAVAKEFITMAGRGELQAALPVRLEQEFKLQAAMLESALLPKGSRRQRMM